MVQTHTIKHSYPGTQRFDFPDINCKASETLLVLGQSGVGKTTLLHILAGILKPESGDVKIDGTSLYSLGSARLDKFRGKHIGMIFQKPHFINAVTAIENLVLARRMAGSDPGKDLARDLLQRLNIGEKSTAYPSEMSQGELQRLSIARALVNQPRLILADEPTSALDDKNCEEVVSLLDRHSKSVNASLIIVTHDKRLKDYFSNFIELN